MFRCGLYIIIQYIKLYITANFHVFTVFLAIVGALFLVSSCFTFEIVILDWMDTVLFLGTSSKHDFSWRIEQIAQQQLYHPCSVQTLLNFKPSSLE